MAIKSLMQPLHLTICGKYHGNHHSHDKDGNNKSDAAIALNNMALLLYPLVPKVPKKNSDQKL
jgi:hypothetical protein